MTATKPNVILQSINRFCTNRRWPSGWRPTRRVTLAAIRPFVLLGNENTQTVFRPATALFSDLGLIDRAITPKKEK